MRAWILWLWGATMGLAVYPLSTWTTYLAWANKHPVAVSPGAVPRGLPIFFVVWMSFIALFLIGYRGGGRLLPVFGYTNWTKVLSILALIGSAISLFVLFGLVQFYRLDHLPFTGFWLALAFYFQWLRAAAVTRSEPYSRDAIEMVFD